MPDPTTEGEDEPQVRPFAAVLRELNRGRVHEELSTQLQDLVAAVQSTGRKGSLSFTLTVSPTGDSGAVQVSDTVSAKLPHFERAASMFYITDEHNLVRSDPRQLELPLQTVTPAKLREAGL